MPNASQTSSKNCVGFMNIGTYEQKKLNSTTNIIEYAYISMQTNYVVVQTIYSNGGSFCKKNKPLP